MVWINFLFLFLKKFLESFFWLNDKIVFGGVI